MRRLSRQVAASFGGACELAGAALIGRELWLWSTPAGVVAVGSALIVYGAARDLGRATRAKGRGE